MGLQARLNIDTRPFVLAGYPVALRKDNQTIEQDAGRSAVLTSRTLMARKLVDSAVVATADGSNTGNGTITLATVAGIDAEGQRVIPKAGTWLFTLTAALVGKITDPDGNETVVDIALNDGTTTVVLFNGLQFTVTDGGTAFVATDFFTLVVVANLKWKPFNSDGVLGEAYPKGIFDPGATVGSILAATLVAGDVTDMPILIAGARFDGDKLILENSGALTDIVLGTNLTVEEYLRQFGLVDEATIAGSIPENAAV